MSLQDTLATPISQGVPYSFALNCHSSTNGIPTILEGFPDYQSGISSRPIVLRSENLSEMVKWINNINSINSSNDGDARTSQTLQQQGSLSRSSGHREHLSFSASDSSHVPASKSADHCSTINSGSRSSSSPNKTLTLEQLSPNATPTTPINRTPPAAATATPLSRDASQRSLVSSLR